MEHSRRTPTLPAQQTSTRAATARKAVVVRAQQQQTRRSLLGLLATGAWEPQISGCWGKCSSVDSERVADLSTAQSQSAAANWMRRSVC